MKLQIVVFDGFDELDAIAPFEALRRAEEAGADLHAELVTQDGADEATAFYGLRVRPTSRLWRADADPADEKPGIVIVPGGGWNHPSPTGARAQAQRGELPAALAALHAQGAIIAGVCTGAMLLAAAGLLTGRPATTHHLAHDELRAAGADLVAARVVDDGDMITASGVTSGLDLALWIVERFASPQIATKVESRLEYERRGTVWRR
ncbi:MAG TPA: DJ-1/PfpI family protein [Ktedonobacterales bacterium]|nr:DJ-1/PfpI family protein [Ktedonobacterales bacterium]